MLNFGTAWAPSQVRALAARPATLLVALALFSLPLGCVRAPDVDFTEPPNGATGVDASTDIVVAFTAQLDPETATEVANFIVSGSVSGPHATVASLDETARFLTITVVDPFSSGETVTVSLTSRITTSISVALDAYEFSFKIAGVSATPEDFDDTTGQFTLITLDPPNGSIALSPRPVVRAGFQRPVFVDTVTTDNVRVRGSLSGLRSAQVSAAELIGTGVDQTANEVLAQLDSSGLPFEPGEHVTVTYTGSLQAPGEEITDDALTLRPFVASFEAKGGIVTGGFSEALPLTLLSAGSFAAPVQAIFADLLPSESPELVVLEESGLIRALGRFGTEPYSPLAELGGAPAVAIAAADIENEGRSDLIVLRNSGAIELWRLAGQSWVQLYEDPLHLIGTQPADLEIADLNGDGFLDIVVAVGEGLEFFQKLPTAGGIRTGFLPIPGDPLVDPAFDVAVGDIDGDGRIDIVAQASSGVAVLRNAGNFLFASVSMLSIAPTTGTLLVADFDGDGFQDVVAGGLGGAFVHLNPGTGVIPGPTWSPVTIPLGAGVAPTQLVVGNFDGDTAHLPDLLCYDMSASPPLVLHQRFGSAVNDLDPVELTLSAPAPIGGIAVADVNRDGARDVLLYGRGVGGAATYLLSTTIDVEGAGDSEFSFLLQSPSSAVLGSDTIPITVSADLGTSVQGFSLAVSFDSGFQLASVELDPTTFPSGGAEVTVLPGPEGAVVTVDVAPSLIMSGDAVPLVVLNLAMSTIEPGDYTIELVETLTAANGEVGASQLQLEGGGVGLPDLSLALTSISIGTSVSPVSNLVCSIVEGTPALEWELPPITTQIYDLVRIRRNAEVIAEISGSSTSYFDSDATGGSIYSVAGVRNGIASLPLSCEPPAIFGTLVCSRLQTSPENIRLTWSTSGSYETITVLRDGTVIAVRPGNATSYIDATGDLDGHFYEVFGTTTAGETTSMAVCADGEVPDFGAGIDVLVPVSSVLLAVDQAVATVTWLNGESYDEISIQRNGVLIATLAGNTASFVDPSLTPGVYTYSVRGSGDGDLGVFVDSNTVSSGPPAPTDFLCTLAGGNQVALSWTNPFVYQSLRVERVGLDGTQLFVLPSGTETSFVDTDVPDGVYEYTVIAASSGFDSPSAPCSIEVRNLIVVSNVLSTPGHRGTIEIEGQLLESVRGYAFSLQYDATQLTLGTISLPGAIGVPFSVVEGPIENGLQTITVTVPDSGDIVIAAGMGRVFAEIEFQTSLDFSAVGTSTLALLDTSLIIASDGSTLIPTTVSGSANVVSRGVFFDPVTVTPGGLVEGWIYGTFDSALVGYSLSFTFDSSLVTIEDITSEGTIADLIPGFFVPGVDNFLGGAALAGIALSDSYPAQVRAPLAFIRMQVNPFAQPVTTAISFTEWVSSNGAVNMNEFFEPSLGGEEGLSFAPTGFDGLITIVGDTTPPNLISIDPNVGPAQGGTQVFLSGSGFLGGVEVRFGDVVASSSVLSNSIVLATTPPGEIGTVDVVVTTVNGTDTLVGAYTYESLQLDSISPAIASVCDPNPIIIEGAGFTADLQVQIGDAIANVLQVLADGRSALVLPPPFADASPTGLTDVDVVATDLASGESKVLPEALHYAAEFIRGDVDGNGSVDADDVSYLASALAGSGPLPAIMDAADANDDGLVHVGDLVYLNLYVSGQGPPPPAPFGVPDADPTPDGLDVCP